MFMQLNPPAGSIEMHKLGSWMELVPGLVVDGGNKHMHGINEGAVHRTIRSKPGVALAATRPMLLLNEHMIHVYNGVSPAQNK